MKVDKIRNRFSDNLREHHQLIADFSHGNCVLRVMCAFEIKKEIARKEKPNILEIGCGGGYFTEYLLKYNPGLKIDALDISLEMIEGAKTRLKEWKKNINFICEDGSDFLEQCGKSYDLILSSWTVHNFSWQEKIKFFKNILGRLSKGGKLFLLDKIYTDGFWEREKRFNLVCERYERYLTGKLRKEIINHTKKDFSDEYRMEETLIREKLREIGFREIVILDREAEEVILIACK